MSGRWAHEASEGSSVRGIPGHFLGRAVGQHGLLPDPGCRMSGRGWPRGEWTNVASLKCYGWILGPSSPAFNRERQWRIPCSRSLGLPAGFAIKVLPVISRKLWTASTR